MLEEKSSISYLTHLIRKVMMQDAGLSYKKINSRPLWYSSSIIKEATTLFWVNSYKNLKHEDLILNINECIIGWWRALYSWYKIFTSQEWQNTRASGSFIFILAIASNYDKTTIFQNSKNFKRFVSWSLSLISRKWNFDSVTANSKVY